MTKYLWFLGCGKLVQCGGDFEWYPYVVLKPATKCCHIDSDNQRCVRLRASFVRLRASFLYGSGLRFYRA